MAPVVDEVTNSRFYVEERKDAYYNKKYSQTRYECA